MMLPVRPIKARNTNRAVTTPIAHGELKRMPCAKTRSALRLVILASETKELLNRPGTFLEALMPPRQV
jgi:hypothetical protein